MLQLVLYARIHAQPALDLVIIVALVAFLDYIY